MSSPSSTAAQLEPSADSKTGFWFFLTAGILFAVMIITQAVLRLVDVFSNHGIEVPVTLDPPEATGEVSLPGTDSTFTAGMDTIVIEVQSLSPAAMGTETLSVVSAVLCQLTLIACLLLLLRSINRGVVFSSRNTALVSVAGVAAVVWVLLPNWFALMTANNALAQAAGDTQTLTLFEINVLLLLFVVFIAGLASTAFGVGHRMSRETEGLI